ncbi:MAG TPA: hypothetical protein VFK05_29360, partial [Polyangiaceae bacterium]|nr:hypothetical protein [Polyangiaceae bacterium]
MAARAPAQLNQASVSGAFSTALGGALASGVRAFVVDSGIVYYSNSAGISATPLADLSQSTSVSPGVVADVLWSDSDNLYLLAAAPADALGVTIYGRVDKSGG